MGGAEVTPPISRLEVQHCCCVHNDSRKGPPMTDNEDVLLTYQHLGTTVIVVIEENPSTEVRIINTEDYTENIYTVAIARGAHDLLVKQGHLERFLEQTMLLIRLLIHRKLADEGES